ncbi:hypothetical protein GCM10009592_04820 [Brachybacterium rhamnosum]|uniref:PD-(D/E)XK nuclease family protein n=1 Tax=Brachybacterium rhamnosum TaxID=173361 RepID=A0ABW4PVA8_9MICO
MTAGPAAVSDIVRMLLPSMSRSLAEQFNVFRVMHHGTHEKQLSNVFAWLLEPDASHELGDTFQKIVLEHVNAGLNSEWLLPASGYRVAQEVATPGDDGLPSPLGDDIADIVLSRTDGAVVIENFGTSDGHGHSYARYLALGTSGERPAAVVLLCQRRETQLLRDGWENAVVLSYGEVLSDLQAHVNRTPAWRRRHPDQDFFIRQMLEHFVEGPAAVNTEDTISFLTTMCETGESARYGHRPRDLASQEFADLVAEHARRQLEDSRKLLADVKGALRTYARAVLMEQVNARIGEGTIEQVVTRFVGKWEWCVELQRADASPTIFLEFGPTAVVEQERVPNPLDQPDYSKLFITHASLEGDGVKSIIQTEVSLAEILAGLSPEDLRLLDAVLAAAAES